MSWLPKSLDPVMKRVGDDYSRHGVEFPLEEVLKIVWALGQPAISLSKFLDRYHDSVPYPGSYLSEAKALLNHIDCVLLELKPERTNLDETYPGMFDGLENLKADLRNKLELDESGYENTRRVLESAGWKYDAETGKLKKGKGHRPREFRNELTCRLYDCLREPFEAGWPELAEDNKNPQELRNHISALLSPLFDSEEIDPRPGGPVYNAIHNHNK